MITHLSEPLTVTGLKREYITRLEAANDETKSAETHRVLVDQLNAWLDGVRDATGYFFNGDYHYFELGIDRSMCCGQFLDWKHHPEDSAP